MTTSDSADHESLAIAKQFIDSDEPTDENEEKIVFCENWTLAENSANRLLEEHEQ